MTDSGPASPFPQDPTNRPSFAVPATSPSSPGQYPKTVPTEESLSIAPPQARLGALPGEGGSPDMVLRRLEVSITRRLDGMLQGDYRGLIPGHGTEPGETRLYAAGDDVRRMDWNVTARMRTAHIRESIADRELETWLVVDLSPSLFFGTAIYEKRDLSLALSLIHI